VLKIPGRAWAPFATVLNLPGTEGLTGIHTEVSPTQDLTRILQSSQVDSVEYVVSLAPATDTLTTLQWRDVSDWTEIFINGIRQTLDDQQPPLTNQRILLNAGLELTGTVASYVSAETFRGGLGSANHLIAEFGALSATHAMIRPEGGPVAPQLLELGEANVFCRQNVSADLAVFVFWFQMLSAEPGVMAAFLGA